mmetsp:Transcript_8819/g.22758  ORF Transcript_8819/g.22758 Transcript_8819/m.22758 type:complete len:207 (-) Transcript_8819:355-975(-)
MLTLGYSTGVAAATTVAPRLCRSSTRQSSRPSRPTARHTRRGCARTTRVSTAGAPSPAGRVPRRQRRRRPPRRGRALPTAGRTSPSWTMAVARLSPRCDRPMAATCLWQDRSVAPLPPVIHGLRLSSSPAAGLTTATTCPTSLRRWKPLTSLSALGRPPVPRTSRSSGVAKSTRFTPKTQPGTTTSPRLTALLSMSPRLSSTQVRT